MRSLLSVRRVVLLTFGAALVACGLDESGLLSPDASIPDAMIADGPSIDAPTADVQNDVIPSGCTTLDASACIDADIPDGWTLIAFAQAVTTCPPDFDPSQYVDNLGLEAGACTCGCTATYGSYSCAGSIAFGSNCGNCGNGVSQCTNKGTFDAGDEAGCFPTGFTSADIAFGAMPSATPIGVGCDASVNNQNFTSSPVTACVPKCTADYCGMGGSFKKCIISTQTTCPAPFQPQDTIGAPGTISVNCTACTCTASQQGSCTGSVSWYTNTNCGNPATGTGTVPSCNTTGATGLGSFHYTPTEPTVHCTPGGGGGGAVFSPPITVCCL